MKHCRAIKGKNIRIRWYTDAASLPQQWEDALPAAHFLKKPAQLAHQQGGAPEVAMMYAMACDEVGKLLLQAAFQVLSVRRQHIRKDAVKNWQYRAWRAFTRMARPKLLVAGQLFRHDVSTVAVSEKLSTYEAFSLYRDVIETAAVRTRVQAVLVKDCAESLSVLFQHHAPEYLLLRNDISMEMKMRESWATVADYEKDLKHKYAQRFRNVRKKLEGVSIRELSTEEVSASAAEIYALYLGVTEHQAVRMGMLSVDFLPSLKSFYGDELRVWGFFEQDKLIAFASAFMQPQSLDMFYIGFDYERNAELQLYFNILFFAIGQAIEARKALLVLGRTALEAKARVGSRPQYLASFLYIRNPLLRGIIARLQARFSEGAAWEERHPFKTE